MDAHPWAPRPLYHPGYYTAYVLDPDGNNVEAVHDGGHPQGFADGNRGRG